MKENAHERARRLIVLGDDGAAAEQQWLQTHLADCEDCQRYGGALLEVASGLRSGGQTADYGLMEQTTRRVRRGAMDWHRRRERTRWVRWSSVSILLFIVVSLRLSWTAFTYLGVRLGYPHAAVQASFTYFWLVPTVVAGITIVIGTALLSGNYRVAVEAKQ